MEFTRVTLESPTCQQDLEWMAYVYTSAILEELQGSPAEGLRKPNTQKQNQIFETLHYNLQDTNRFFLLLAKEGSQRLGYFLAVVKDCLAEDPPQMGYINGLYVIPQLRGKGLAQMMYDQGTAWFNALNIKNVELYIALGNQQARDFWKKNGYFPTEEIWTAKLK